MPAPANHLVGAIESQPTHRTQEPSGRALSRIGQISIEADCLIAGFDESGIPLIVQAHGHDGVHIRDDFAVAGEGSYLAQYGLLHRDHYDVHPLSTTIYCVYEAKKYAERVASVGRATYFIVVRPDGSAEMLTVNGLKYLEEQFQKFGPHGLDRQTLVIEPNFFGRLKTVL